ncbi:MAG TPA: nucleotidyl transferase AbiEii/AbiGii toxin family protein [Solirubrobacteraceae bacterium]|nr:nucleotidyl transferase AbiEii/AbiGii toxin family protein [Solirubrobacteraceae bacterium]
MIAQAYLNEWASRAPWPTQVQIEQDLVLSRLIVEIAGHELLGEELAFRGGTCLHKLHLPLPLRYSEDLDYVRGTRSGIKPYLTALREVALGVGLVEHGTTQSGQMVHIVFDAQPTGAPGRIRVKIEMNIAETESFLPRTTLPYAVESGWWSGRAEVRTFQIEELMATKLRALYQRRKGRDLFDLWHVLTDLEPNEQLVIDGLAHYMAGGIFSYHDLSANLAAKLENRDFLADLDQLTATTPSQYSVPVAADLVMERLGSKLPGSPDLSEIQAGHWRTSNG